MTDEREEIARACWIVMNSAQEQFFEDPNDWWGHAKRLADQMPNGPHSELVKRFYSFADAILARAQGPGPGEAVADGWVMVPREPKVEMLGAFWRVKNGHHFADEPPPTDTSDYAAYRAMIATTPTREA